MASIFEAKEVYKYFGGIKAVDGFSMDVGEKQITGLIGPNGAGKTTFFNVAAGIYSPDRGEISFKGDRIGGLRPDQICQKGLTRTFQIARGLGDMTVWENVMLAPKRQTGENPFGAFCFRRVRKEEKEHWERAAGLLQEMGLYGQRNEYARNLSAGERKMLEISRAIMTDPEILLLDEPTAGATVDETKKIMAEIGRLRDERGYTFLVVEHKMEVIMNICNPIYVMHNGQNLADGSPREVQTNEQVREVYLGG